jgi:SAM-dependent methyltransferase
MKLPFALPPTLPDSELPHWSGKAFVIGDQRRSVLEYSENFAGWSDDLTTLHEAAVGHHHPIDVASRANALAQISQLVSKPDAVIMEIGCSSGFLLAELVEAFPTVAVVGADVVKEPLYRLAENLPGVPLIRFDLLRCPLPEQIADVIVMLNVLEHIEDDVAALNNVVNVLKPGGHLVIEVPAGPHLYDSYDSELCHFRRYSASELQQKIEKVGFTVVRRSHLGFILYPAFCAVKLINKWRLRRKNTSLVRDQASRTSASLWVRLAMKLESSYLINISLPFGIRALAVAQRPN